MSAMHTELKHIGHVGVANMVVAHLLGSNVSQYDVVLESTEEPLRSQLEYIIDFVKTESICCKDIPEETLRQCCVMFVHDLLKKQMEDYYGNVV